MNEQITDADRERMKQHLDSVRYDRPPSKEEKEQLRREDEQEDE